MRKRSELFFSLILVPLDYLALLAAFVAAYILRVKIDARPVAYAIAALTFLKIALITLPVWILIFALSGLYNQSNLRGKLSELGKVFIAVSGGVMFLILLDFMQRTPLFPSKAVPIYAYGLGLLFVLSLRIVVRAVQRSLFSINIGVHRTVLVGSGKLAQHLVRELSHARAGYQLLGAIDTARGAGKRLPGLPIYASLSEAIETLGERGIDEIIQADSALEQDEVLNLVNYAANNHIVYRFVPNQFGLYATNSQLVTMAGIPVMEIRLTPLEGWGRIVKRGFDLVGATLGLILLSPLFLVISVAIKLKDPGPIFFRHRRLSRTGQAVYMYKFRSMKHMYGADPRYRGKTPEEIFTLLGRPELAEEFARDQKVANDPRVSGVGHFLRVSSLDELPQLINVLRGEMSLVGPRPIVQLELERYGSQGAAFLALKPGVTGLWQVSGRSEVSYEDRVKLDIYYVENWSLWLDIKILVRTVWVVIGRRGAY